MAILKDGENQGEKIVSFLMVGQSNMAGRGDFGEVEPIENEYCHMLRMGRWQKMREPVNTDRYIFGDSYHSGIGPAPEFARCYAEHFHRHVGLIPCADGGTHINQWQPGELLYDHAVMQTKLALRTSTLGGILWHQGESDSPNFNKPLYRERFLRFVEHLRRDLHAEELPFIAGEITHTVAPNWCSQEEYDRMNALLHELEAEIPHFTVVSSEGLSMKPDGIHFDSASCRIFGRRYFNAYLKMR